jgi:hypothetical protein
MTALKWRISVKNLWRQFSFKCCSLYREARNHARVPCWHDLQRLPLCSAVLWYYTHDTSWSVAAPSSGELLLGWRRFREYQLQTNTSLVRHESLYVCDSDWCIVQCWALPIVCTWLSKNWLYSLFRWLLVIEFFYSWFWMLVLAAGIRLKTLRILGLAHILFLPQLETLIFYY